MNLRWIKYGRDWWLFAPDAEPGAEWVGHMHAPPKGRPWRFCGFYSAVRGYRVDVQAGSSLAARRLAEREIDRQSIGLLGVDAITFEVIQ